MISQTGSKQNPTVFILLENWVVDGEQGMSFEVYTDFDDAKRILEEKLKEERATGFVSAWNDSERFVQHHTPSNYECYIEDEYFENRYHLTIITEPICVSDKFVREMAEVHNASCWYEDFIAQVENLEESKQLSDKQYQQMIRDPRIPERIEKALGRNNACWESYWATVSEVAYMFINEYKNLDLYSSGKEG